MLERGQPPLVASSSIGTGKTHLAIALGMEATRRRLRVHYARAADLVQSLDPRKSPPRRAR
jgi:DNA replication protein DnaC